MFALAGLLSLAAVSMAAVFVVALVAGVAKLVFKIALFPLTLGLGLLKLLLLPIIVLVGAILLVVVGPVLLVALLLFVPLALFGAIAWTGVRTAGAIL